MKEKRSFGMLSFLSREQNYINHQLMQYLASDIGQSIFPHPPMKIAERECI